MTETRRQFIKKGALWVAASSLGPRILSGFAGITLIQHNTVSNGTAVTSLAWGGAVASGNLLVVGIVSSSSGTVVTATSTRATLARVGSRAFFSGGGGSEVWWGIATSTGTDTISMTFSGGATNAYPFLYEYHSTAGWPSNPTDPTSPAATGGGTSTAPASGTLVTAGGNDLLFALTSSNGSAVTVTAGTGYADLIQGTGSPAVMGAVEDKLNVAAGSYTAAFSLSSSSNWTVSLVGFKDNTAPAVVNAVPQIL